MKAAIIANGSIDDYEYIKECLETYDYIICSDGGARHAYKMDVIPSLLVGDFDSLDKSILNYYIELGVETDRFPPEKDATDTHLAIDKALEKGATHIDLFGASGSRLDHTLSNIFHLFYIRGKGCIGSLIDAHNRIFLAKDRNELKGSTGQIVSLVAISEQVDGITLVNFKYPLNEVTLIRGDSIGISNEMLTETGIVYKRCGELLIILSKD